MTIMSFTTGGCCCYLPTVDLYQNMLKSGNEDSFLFGPSANFIARALVGCTSLVVVHSLDIAHTRLVADIGKTKVCQFRGTYHFLTTIHKAYEIRGIYRGLPASLQRIIVHRGIYFGAFDTMKERMFNGSEVPLWKCYAGAQVVSTSVGLISYPLDTVRRRMMMQSDFEKPMYKSTFDCWRMIYRTKGLPSVYRGTGWSMFRSIGNAAILVLYDEVKRFINWGGL